MKTLLKPFQILWQGQQGLSIHGHQSKEITFTWRPISPITQIVFNKSIVVWNKKVFPKLLPLCSSSFLLGTMFTRFSPTYTNLTGFPPSQRNKRKAKRSQFSDPPRISLLGTTLTRFSPTYGNLIDFHPHCETTVGWDKQSVPNVHPYFSKSRPFVSVVLLYDRPGPALLRHAD